MDRTEEGQTVVRFTTTLTTGGGNATGIEVPEDVMAQLTPARKTAVVVTLNGYEYRSSVGWYRGAFMLPVSAEHRGGAGISAGDEVEVTLEVDDAPRIVVVPGDLQAALDAEPEASAAWQKLSYSSQNAHALSITGAKTDETRGRRITAVLEKLRA